MKDNTHHWYWIHGYDENGFEYLQQISYGRCIAIFRITSLKGCPL